MNLLLNVYVNEYLKLEWDECVFAIRYVSYEKCRRGNCFLMKLLSH